jgi:tetratricopeptide (TPR) repeat protein
MPLLSRFALLGLLLLFVLVGCGPSAAEQAVQRGNAAFEEMDLQAAIAAYDEALALDSSQVAAYYGRGRIYWTMNRHADAIDDMNRVLELAPDLTWAHYYRGASRLMQGEYEAGVEDLAEATTVDTMPPPDLMRAHRLHAIGLMNLERYATAIDALSRAIEQQPDVALNYWDRGQLYEATDQPAQARADYEAVLQHAPEDSPRAADARRKLDAMAE